MRRFWAATGAVLAAQASWGQVREIPYAPPAAAPTIDGELTPGEWPDAARGTDFFDENGGVSTLPVEFWLTSDKSFVYVAVRVKADPKTLRNQNYRRNSGLNGDDRATLIIDGSGTGNDSDRFSFNASTGNSISLKGGRAAKREWIGEFDSKGRITETGWEGEARIPWSLVSDAIEGTRSIKFLFEIDISRTDREAQFQRLGGDRTAWPIWRGVPVPAIDRSSSILALPYATLRYDEDLRGSFGFNSGVDFKTQMSSGITYVATVNPDFRNVEGEVLDLGFSYFERSTNETRPFFLEGQDDLPDNIFNSQRIRQIDAAVKAYGPLNTRMRFGVLHTQRFGDQSVTAVGVSGSTPSLLSWSAEAVQNDEPGRDNTALRMGLNQRVGTWNAGFNVKRTDDQEVGQGGDWSASLSKFSNRGFTRLSYSEVTDDYLARLDFQGGTGNKGVNYNQSVFSTSRSGWIQGASLDFGFSQRTRLNGDHYSKNRYVNLGVTLRNTLEANVSASAGEFLENKDHNWGAGIGFFPNDPNRSLGFEYEKGRVGGLDFNSWGVGAFYRPQINWRLTASYSEFERVELERQAIVSASYDLDEFHTIAARAVLRGDLWSWYASFGQTGKKGTEYFLIIGDPNSDEFRPTVALKVLTPFELKF